MNVALSKSLALIGILSLASCTSHLRRDPSSVGSCNLFVKDLNQVVSLSDHEKMDLLSRGKKNDWNLIFNKSELREGDHILSGLIENRLMKKISYRNNYVYFIPYNLKIEENHSAQKEMKVSQIGFDHSYEISSLELTTGYGLKGRSIASHNFKKSYNISDRKNPFFSQFENEYFNMSQLEGGVLTSSQRSDKESMLNLFRDVVGDLPKCSSL